MKDTKENHRKTSSLQYGASSQEVKKNLGTGETKKTPTQAAM
jgi:hypothetical protein